MLTEMFKILVIGSPGHEDVLGPVAHALRAIGLNAGTLMGRVVPGGVIRDHTQDVIDHSDMLLYVASDSDDSNAGHLYHPMYLLGLFANKTPKRPIAILYPIHYRLPYSFSGFHSFSSSKSHLTQFLRALCGDIGFTKTEAPLLGTALDARRLLDETATTIARVLDQLPTGNYRIHTSSLQISISNTDGGNIPTDSHIVLSHDSLRIFGLLHDDNLTLGRLFDIDTRNKQVLLDISDALLSIMSERVPKPILSRFYGQDNYVYQAVVYREEVRLSNARQFDIILIRLDEEQIDRSMVFTVMSFSNDMGPIFEAICDTAKSVNLIAKRVSDVFGDYKITDKIISMIRTARIVLVDLTHERPNVYFELGYARGIGKTVITTVRKGSSVHFDVKDWTYIEYADSRDLERELVKRLTAFTADDGVTQRVQLRRSNSRRKGG